MLSKLEQLKKEIQRLRPEIGVFCSNCQEELINGKHKYGATRIGKTYCSTGHISYRPITLDDVLFCCIEAYSKFGIITKKSYEEMLGGVVGLWDFTKDFDNQSEEFYDEIMFLLQ